MTVCTGEVLTLNESDTSVKMHLAPARFLIQPFQPCLVTYATTSDI